MDITDKSKIDTIYNYEPAYNNLYEVEIMDDSSMNEHLKLHSVAVSLGGESLNLVRNDVSKLFQIDASKGFNLADTLSITWRENDAWQVRKYHEDWLSEIYDRDTDRFVSCPISDTSTKQSFLRTINIILPKSSAMENSFNKIVCHDVIPKTTPKIDLRWGPSAQVVQHTIEYYVSYWDWSKED